MPRRGDIIVGVRRIEVEQAAAVFVYLLTLRIRTGDEKMTNTEDNSTHPEVDSIPHIDVTGLPVSHALTED
jgi:hypothetical protein